jgi:hypothetical protein
VFVEVAKSHAARIAAAESARLPSAIQEAGPGLREELARIGADMQAALATLSAEQKVTAMAIRCSVLRI